MDNATHFMVHRYARALNLQTKPKCTGKKCHGLFKTDHTKPYQDRILERVEERLGRGFIPKMDYRGRNLRAVRKAGASHSPRATPIAILGESEEPDTEDSFSEYMATNETKIKAEFSEGIDTTKIKMEVEFSEDMITTEVKMEAESSDGMSTTEVKMEGESSEDETTTKLNVEDQSFEGITTPIRPLKFRIRDFLSSDDTRYHYPYHFSWFKH
jgi:hypothetical protein